MNLPTALAIPLMMLSGVGCITLLIMLGFMPGVALGG